MIDYVHQNPDRAWQIRQRPDLFRLRRDTVVAGMRFSSMGNHWLLQWPIRQAIVCSRSISDEALATAESTALARAANGAVTYSAAISPGEQRIMRTVRNAGYPVVVLLKDGFPPAGSPHERYYKPGGVYFETCCAGRLLLLEATAQTFALPAVIAATDDALYQKAQARHMSYTPPQASARAFCINLL